MPNLRPGEKMQRCLALFHAQHRRQKYYIKRKYYNELEQKFCPGCCGVLETMGLVKYSIGDGYAPTRGRKIDSILSAYGSEVVSGR